MKQYPVESLQVTFKNKNRDGNSYYGWIYLDLRIGNKAYYVHISNVYPPFERMFEFFEELLTEVNETSFGIDQEGKDIDFYAYKTEDSQDFVLRIAEDGAESLTAIFNRKQFVTAFIDALELFIKTEYDEEAWSALGAFGVVNYDKSVDLNNLNFEKIKTLLD